MVSLRGAGGGLGLSLILQNKHSMAETVRVKAGLLSFSYIPATLQSPYALALAWAWRCH